MLVLIALLTTLSACRSTTPAEAPSPSAPLPLAAITCGAIVPGGISDGQLEVSVASYFGSEGADGLQAAAIASDCAVLLAGRYTGTFPAEVTEADLIAGKTGVLLRLSTDGTSLHGVTRLGDVVRDIGVHPVSGEIAVAGDFGVALLTHDGTQLLWTQAGAAVRVAIGSDGTVAALRGRTVTMYDKSGQVLGTVSLSHAVSDVAVSGEHATLFLTGFKQDDGYRCSKLQIAYLHAYTYTGSLKWRAYDWTNEQAGDKSLCADTRGYRVTMGADGYLYFAGESAGGNSIFQRDPKNLQEDARNVTTDKFHHPYNTASNHITYYARFHPETGEQRLGQFVLTRLSNDRGNTIRVRDGAITADEQGNVYLVGESACCLANRDGMVVNGTAVGTNYPGGGYVLVVSSDFTRRELWTVFSQSGGKASLRGVAARGGMVVAVGTASADDMVQVRALQSAASTTVSKDAPDGFFAVWSGLRPTSQPPQ